MNAKHRDAPLNLSLIKLTDSSRPKALKLLLNRSQSRRVTGCLYICSWHSPFYANIHNQLTLKFKRFLNIFIFKNNLIP